MKYVDVALAGLIVAVISLMIVPLPPWIIDLLLAVNLAVSVLLLATALYIPGPLALSTFPSLLLFTTLLRLSLNIASTKLILLHANAGHIIETFGRLVVGNSVVVGAVVFVIIAIVQFIVIAKGSERVAEVGARFTLDAMPGKQMSIDAELRAGQIAPREARQKRKDLERESQFHGGMDGAMKFVKGDAIAGLIIALVNGVGGVAIGVVINGMSFAEALSRYTILTVGDGMVSQIPSLFISIAAGIVITRVASSGSRTKNLGAEIAGELTAQPKAWIVVSVILLGFTLVPGFPAIPFLVLSLSAAYIAWKFSKSAMAKGLTSSSSSTSSAGEAQGGAASAHFSNPLSIELSHSLRTKINLEKIQVNIENVRFRAGIDLGFPMPAVSVNFSDAVAERALALSVQGVVEYQLVLGETDYYQLPENSTKNNIRGEQALEIGQWIQASNPAESSRVLNREEFVAEALLLTFRKHCSRLLGMQEVFNLLKDAQARYPDLVQEVQKSIPPQRIADVLRRLTEESISIRNFSVILESLLNWAPREKDIIMLTECVRVDLGRQIASTVRDDSGSVSAFVVDPRAEAAIRQSVQQTPSGSFAGLSPDQTQRLLNQLDMLLHKHKPPDGARLPILLTSMDVRRYLRKLVERTHPELIVLSYQEVATGVNINALARLEG